MHKRYISALLAATLLFVYPVTLHSEEVRLAIIDVDQNQPVPEDLLDFLLIELSKDSGITLLERDKIEIILKEQKLSLSLNENINSSDIIKTGEILAADAVLMLKNEDVEKDIINLRLRLVDSRHGLKLLDSYLSIESNSPEYEQKAKLIAASLIQHIERVNIHPEQLLSVGVSTFKSEEMSHRWDWLSDTIPTIIEQNLILYPGICLMERIGVKPLLDEREISNGLPDSITSSAILLEGTYQIDRTKETISILIKAKRNSQILFEVPIEGRLNEIELLCREGVKAIIEKSFANPVPQKMDPVIEAKMLGAEASAYLRRHEYFRALSPAEAAHALMPQSPEYMELIIRALMENPLDSIIHSNKEINSLAKSRFRVLNLAERIIRNYPLPNDKNLDSKQERACFLMHSRAMEKGFTAMLFGTERMKDDKRYQDLYSEMNRGALSFYEVCNERYTNQSNTLRERLLYEGGRLLGRIEDINETIRITQKILEEQVEMQVKLYGHFELPHPERLFAISEFYYAVRENWLKENEALEKAAQFLMSLCKSSNNEVRLQALDYSMRFYSEIKLNHEQLRNLGKEYTEFCKIVGYPNPMPISEKPFFPDDNASEEFELALLEEIINFSIHNRLVRTNTPEWSHGTERFAELLEKQGRTDDAINYLKKMMEIFNRRDWRWQNLRIKINDLQTKHPELKINVVTPSDVNQLPNPILVLSITDKELNDKSIKNIRFRRCVIDESEIIIVFSVQGEEQYSVLRLDRRIHRSLAIQTYEKMRQFKSQMGNDYLEYNLGPSVVVHEGNVYLGFMHEGFLIFNRDGTIRRLNEDNGLVYNKIRHLECLGDKIYAIIGASRRESGIMELDIKTGISKIITSTRIESPKCELDNTEIKGIVADPNRNILWVLSGNSVNSNIMWNKLYGFDPTSGRFQKITTEELEEFLQETTFTDNIHDLQIYGDFLVIYNGRGLCELNLKKMNVTSLINYRHAKWNFPWYMYPDMSFLPVKNGMLCVSYNQLLYFRDGKKEPFNISKSLFNEPDSDKLGIKDLVQTEEGLYILTANNLYFICKEEFDLINIE